MNKSLFLNLKLIELQIFLEHIRLGPDHVTELLNKKQLAEVLELGCLTQEQLREVTTDRIEKIGSVALVLNSIITSTFGAWMGLSGCIGLTLGSTAIFTTVTSMACLMSAAIGYNSYQMIKEQAANAIKRQKLANLELKIFSRINDELQKKIYKLERGLYRAVEGKLMPNNRSPTNYLQTEEEATVWLEQIKTFMQQSLQEVPINPAYHVLKKDWNKHFKKIRKILKTHFELVNQLSAEPAKQHDLHILKNRYGDASGVELLIDPTLVIPKVQVKAPSWLEKNGRTLLVSLAPTLLGGFASMFVFIGGVPNIAQAFGYERSHAFLTHFYARLVEIGLAVSVALCFGYAHFYSARKSAQRAAHLTKTRQAITNQETATLAKNAHVKMLYQVTHLLSRMFSP